MIIEQSFFYISFMVNTKNKSSACTLTFSEKHSQTVNQLIIVKVICGNFNLLTSKIWICLSLKIS